MKNTILKFDSLIGYDYFTNSISGIWNSYGCIPEDGNNLTFYLEEGEEGSDSLIQLCGFDTEKRQIGVLSQNKNISELVVMLPMLEKQLEYTDPPEDKQPPEEKDPCAPCDEMVDPCGDKDTDTASESNPKNIQDPNLVYCKTEDSWLFVILNDEVNKKIDQIMYEFISSDKNGYAVYEKKKHSIEQIKQSVLEKIQSEEISLSNTIWKQVYNMVTYNIPPHLNWLLDDSVPRYLFYGVEFNHQLSKQDLSDIWQGTMPRIATTPEEEEISIEHELNLEEIFGGYDIANIVDIKLSVFKCKMRAHNDYYRDLVREDQTARQPREWYQYNWPYDYFSLVELLKVEGWEKREYIDTTSETAGSGSAPEEAKKNAYKEARDAYVASHAAYTPSLYK